MAKRGRKLAPALERYEPAGRKTAVYVVEIGQCVKVGRSRTPVDRLRALHRLHAGEVMGRFCVFPVAPASCWQAENAAICALRRHAEPTPGRLEYFVGIDYEAAVSVVRSAVTHL